MPEISRFYGIVITIYYDEHLPPHFHARYGEDRAAFLLSGETPSWLDAASSERFGS
jgi:hypothetical protein